MRRQILRRNSSRKSGRRWSHWCKTYDGHVPFQLEDVTPDKLKERFGKDASFCDYGFVINGITLSVVDDHGAVCVSYLMSGAAAELLQLPKNPRGGSERTLTAVNPQPPNPCPNCSKESGRN
jgi:hypothetical protein